MVSGVRFTTLPVMVTTLSRRVGSTRLEQRARNVEHALDQAVMVAEVDEDQVAVVALPMDPAGDPHHGPRIGGTKGAAGMGAVGMHGRVLPRRKSA